jgi:hypothetical protein
LYRRLWENLRRPEEFYFFYFFVTATSFDILYVVKKSVFVIDAAEEEVIHQFRTVFAMLFSLFSKLVRRKRARFFQTSVSVKKVQTRRMAFHCKVIIGRHCLIFALVMPRARGRTLVGRL